MPWRRDGALRQCCLSSHAIHRLADFFAVFMHNNKKFHVGCIILYFRVLLLLLSLDWQTTGPRIFYHLIGNGHTHTHRQWQWSNNPIIQNVTKSCLSHSHSQSDTQSLLGQKSWLHRNVGDSAQMQRMNFCPTVFRRPILREPEPATLFQIAFLG